MTDDLSEMVDQAAAGMSEPTAGAAAAVAAAASSAETFGAENTDAGGAGDPAAGVASRPEQFVPGVHATDAAGYPRKTADGSRLQKKRGRKPKARRPAPAADAGDDDAGDAAELPELPPSPGEIRAAAVRGADFFFMVCQGAGPLIEASAPWEPTPAERDNLISQLERFYETHGIIADLPPGLALVGAVGMYVLPRVTGRIRQLAGAVGIPLPAPVPAADDQAAAAPAPDPEPETIREKMRAA